MVERIMVDINHAEEEELTTVPGIGPSLAKRITIARPFASHDDITRVTGINLLLLERLKPHLMISPSPVAAVDQVSEEPAANAEEAAPSPRLPDDEAVIDKKLSAESGDDSSFPPPSIPQEAAGTETVAEQVEEIYPVEVIDEESERDFEVHDKDQEYVKEPSKADVESHTEEREMEPQPIIPVSNEETVQTVEKADEEAVSSSSERTPKFVTQGQAVWIGLLIFIFAVAFGVALSLGILTGINGRLRYASPDEVAALSRDINALSARITTLQDAIDSVQQRLDNLELVSGRVDVLESTAESIQADVDGLILKTNSLDESLTQLDEELTTLQDNMETLSEQTGRFQTVMDGLRDILNSIFPDE